MNDGRFTLFRIYRFTSTPISRTKSRAQCSVPISCMRVVACDNDVSSHRRPCADTPREMPLCRPASRPGEWTRVEKRYVRNIITTARTVRGVSCRTDPCRNKLRSRTERFAVVHVRISTRPARAYTTVYAAGSDIINRPVHIATRSVEDTPYGHEYAVRNVQCPQSLRLGP